MNKEKQDMLESSLKKINDKLQWLGTCALEIRRAIESVNNVLSSDVPILHAIRLTKFKFIDQTGDFDGEDVELLDPEEHKCWNRILEREAAHMKRVTANRDIVLVYKTSLDDVGEDANKLRSRYAELYKKLQSELPEIQIQSKGKVSQDNNRSTADKFFIALVVVITIFLLGSGMLVVSLGDEFGWVSIVLSVVFGIWAVLLYTDKA